VRLKPVVAQPFENDEMDIQFGQKQDWHQRENQTARGGESNPLVRSATDRRPDVWIQCEDPHCDARGFRVRIAAGHRRGDYFAQTRTDPDVNEIKRDSSSAMGAALQRPCSPEYCTPNAAPARLLQQDYSGDAVLMACRPALASIR